MMHTQYSHAVTELLAVLMSALLYSGGNVRWCHGLYCSKGWWLQGWMCGAGVVVAAVVVIVAAAMQQGVGVGVFWGGNGCDAARGVYRVKDGSRQQGVVMQAWALSMSAGCLCILCDVWHLAECAIADPVCSKAHMCYSTGSRMAVLCSLPLLLLRQFVQLYCSTCCRTP